MTSLTSAGASTLTYRELHPPTPGQNVPQMYEITHFPFQTKGHFQDFVSLALRVQFNGRAQEDSYTS